MNKIFGRIITTVVLVSLASGIGALICALIMLDFASTATLAASSVHPRYVSPTHKTQGPVSRSYDRSRVETFVVTAYSLDECGKSINHPLYGVTASGRKLAPADSHKVVAVDNSRIKFGTRMILHSPTGPIHVIAADTGGDIQGNRLDLFISDDGEAWKWGRKTMKVTVYE